MSTPLTPEQAAAIRTRVAERVAAWYAAPDPEAVIGALSKTSLNRLLASAAGPAILAGLLEPGHARFWRLGLVKAGFLAADEARGLEEIERGARSRPALDLGPGLPAVTPTMVLEALGMADQGPDQGQDPSPWPDTDNDPPVTPADDSIDITFNPTQ